MHNSFPDGYGYLLAKQKKKKIQFFYESVLSIVIEK